MGPHTRHGSDYSRLDRCSRDSACPASDYHLTAAGGMYGAFVLVMMIVGDPSRVSQLGYAGPSIMITNLVWGGIAGLIAEGIRRVAY